MRRAALLLLCSALLLTGCGEEIVVRIEAALYEDGTLYRRVGIFGRDGKDRAPDSVGWLAADAGVALAAPDRWRIVDEGPGIRVVEAIFPPGSQVPTAIEHRSDEVGNFYDRFTVERKIDDLVLLTRWHYEERRGDPFGSAADVDALAQELAALLGDGIAASYRAHFGEAVDRARLDGYLQLTARKFLRDILGALTSLFRESDEQVAEERIRRVFRRHEIPLPAPSAGLPFEELMVPAADGLIDTMRLGIAEALSTPEAPVDPFDLNFMMSGEELVERLENEVFSVDPELDARFTEFAERAARTLSGYYGAPGNPFFRFEVKLEMPGQLLRTNGTATRNGVVWFYRGADTVEDESRLSAESIELDLDALTGLGARTDFDEVELLQLVDLLTRDETGEFLGELREAVRRGKLDPPRPNDDEHDDENPTASLLIELADLLDPDRDAWPGR